MPTIWPPVSSGEVVSPSLTRKTVVLLTVVTSMGPLNETDSRGCRLKPSSVLMTLTSAWSDGRLAASGSGRLIRRLVSWLASATVNRSLGNGPRSGLSRSNAAKVLGTERSSSLSTRRWLRGFTIVSSRCGLREDDDGPLGAQTVRRGGAGPVGGLLGGKDPTGRLLSRRTVVQAVLPNHFTNPSPA